MLGSASAGKDFYLWRNDTFAASRVQYRRTVLEITFVRLLLFLSCSLFQNQLVARGVVQVTPFLCGAPKNVLLEAENTISVVYSVVHLVLVRFWREFRKFMSEIRPSKKSCSLLEF